MKFLKWLVKIISTGLSCVLLVYPFSPMPACLLVRNAFRFGTAVKPKNYKSLAAQTKTVRGLCYDDRFKQCVLDIIVPNKSCGGLPVIFWLHGGAFISGSRQDAEEYAVLLAAHGYAVINVDYPLAPEHPYPTGVQAVAKAYSFSAARSEQYQLDFSRVCFAGDSAGAQMAAQFVTAQADGAYAKMAGIPRVVPFSSIRATALFCGLYDVPEYAAKFDSHTPAAYVIRRVFWGATGNKNWRHGKEIMHASVLRYIPDVFPPTFLTDGNFATFTGQGMRYARMLQERGTSVDAVFYPRSEKLLRHEYQFNMRSAHAQNTFARLLGFLEQMKK